MVRPLAGDKAGPATSDVRLDSICADTSAAVSSGDIASRDRVSTSCSSAPATSADPSPGCAAEPSAPSVGAISPPPCRFDSPIFHSPTLVQRGADGSHDSLRSAPGAHRRSPSSALDLSTKTTPGPLSHRPGCSTSADAAGVGTSAHNPSADTATHGRGRNASLASWPVLLDLSMGPREVLLPAGQVSGESLELSPEATTVAAPPTAPDYPASRTESGRPPRWPTASRHLGLPDWPSLAPRNWPTS
jgi:hypothetical protein